MSEDILFEQAKRQGLSEHLILLSNRASDLARAAAVEAAMPGTITNLEELAAAVEHAQSVTLMYLDPHKYRDALYSCLEQSNCPSDHVPLELPRAVLAG